MDMENMTAAFTKCTLAIFSYHNYMEILIQEIKITEFAHI